MRQSFTVCAFVDGVFQTEVIQADDFSQAKFVFTCLRDSKEVHILGAFYGACKLIDDDISERPLPIGAQVKLNNHNHPAFEQSQVGSVIQSQETNGAFSYVIDFEGFLITVPETQFENGEFQVIPVQTGLVVKPEKKSQQSSADF